MLAMDKNWFCNLWNLSNVKTGCVRFAYVNIIHISHQNHEYFIFYSILQNKVEKSYISS